MTVEGSKMTTQTTNGDVSAGARELYARLRPDIETPENIGRMVIMDVDTGEYEIDETGLDASRLLRSRHPDARLFGMRIGYKAAETFGGVRERIETP